MATPPEQSLAAPYPGYEASTNVQLKTGLAIASLVIGVLNFLFFGILVIPIVVGIVISVVALKKVKENPDEYGGKSLAMGGLVTNIVSAVLLVPFLIIAAIAIPNLLASRMAANERDAQSSLSRIHEAEVTYQVKTGHPSCATLAELERQSLIPPELASGEHWGYRFRIEPDKGTDGGWALLAAPTAYRASGIRSFFIDETGVLRGEDIHGLDATRFSPPVNFNGDDPYTRPQARRSSRNADDD